MSLLLHTLGRGLDEAAHWTPGRPSVAGWLELRDAILHGWDSEQAGDLGAARLAYQRALDTGPGWVRQRAAAVSLVLGRIDEATRHCAVLTENTRAADQLIYARLLLEAGRHAEAVVHLELGATMAMYPSGEPDGLAEGEDDMTNTTSQQHPSGTVIQRLVEEGQDLLRRGRYVLAAGCFNEAMGLVESLLMAHGTWVVAERDGGEGRAAVLEAVVSLARLADALLRCQAKVKLAGTLAEALRARELREDLAPWATGGHEVQALLEAEYERLTQAAADRPNHAELWFRVGVMARALDRMADAARALRHVLAICPHHVGAAARLAATLVQLERPEDAADVLLKAEKIDAVTLRQQYGLAVASREPARFEQAVAAVEQARAPEAEVRANLAFSLGMMGALDQAVRQWKEPVGA